METLERIEKERQEFRQTVLSLLPEGYKENMVDVIINLHDKEKNDDVITKVNWPFNEKDGVVWSKSKSHNGSTTIFL